MTPKEHVEQLADNGEEILLCEGLEEALMGVQQTFEKGGITFRALYSLNGCVTVLMGRDGMTYATALEFLEFNTLGAFVGPSTPSFLLDLDVETVRVRL